MDPVCLVMGAGAGIGGNVGKRFAKGGYHAVLCRRSDAHRSRRTPRPVTVHSRPLHGSGKTSSIPLPD